MNFFKITFFTLFFLFNSNFVQATKIVQATIDKGIKHALIDIKGKTYLNIEPGCLIIQVAVIKFDAAENTLTFKHIGENKTYGLNGIRFTNGKYLAEQNPLKKDVVYKVQYIEGQFFNFLIPAVPEENKLKHKK
jgi:hypothetical protein